MDEWKGVRLRTRWLKAPKWRPPPEYGSSVSKLTCLRLPLRVPTWHLHKENSIWRPRCGLHRLLCMALVKGWNSLWSRSRCCMNHTRMHDVVYSLLGCKKCFEEHALVSFFSSSALVVGCAAPLASPLVFLNSQLPYAKRILKSALESRAADVMSQLGETEREREGKTLYALDMYIYI